MTDADATIMTPYGRLDRAALTRAQSCYDTTALLGAVEELDRIARNMREEHGLRDILLRLHGMSHAVINGAGLSGSLGEEDLPELAFEANAEIFQIISTLQRWVKLIEPIEGLQPRD